MKNRFVRGILVGVSVFLVTVLIWHLDFFQIAEWKSWDLRLRLLSKQGKANPDIVLLLIDQYSLDIYEESQGMSWPWPREMYSYLVDFCEKGGAKALCFDLVFSEPSVYGIEDDRTFAESAGRFGKVFIPFALSRDKSDTANLPLSLSRVALESRKTEGISGPEVASAALPVGGLLEKARGLGNINFTQDADGIFRRIPLVFKLGGLMLPSLAWAVADFVNGEEDLTPIPMDRNGRMIIGYPGPAGAYKTYSIASVINSYAQLMQGSTPQIPPEEFAGKIILVGGSAPGLLDLRPTPFSAVSPGVAIHAAAIDNLIQRSFFRDAPASFLVALILIFSLAAGVITSQLKKTWALAVALPILLFVPLAAASVAFYQGYWLEAIAPLFSVLMAFISASLLNYAFEGRQRRFIKSAFRFYLNPHVIDQVVENPELLRLGGEQRTISSFFSDVAGFTSISEALEPEILVELLNTYLSDMTDIILNTGGTLDKYEGDAIIGFWNAPLNQNDHGLRACRAAIECQRKLEEMNPFLKEKYGFDLHMRIGINSGPAVVGNMGSRERFDYTAMGDTVNLAARLEGACKQYGIGILIGENTFAEAGDALVVREVDRVRVVGKSRPIRIYEIIAEKGAAAQEKIEEWKNFEEARELFSERKWEEAEKRFQRLSGDPVARVYLSRLKRFRQEPPPMDWDGIFDLTAK